MDGSALDNSIEARTQQIGRQLFARANAIGDREPWLDRVLMHQAMRDPRLKAELFRFTDVLPALNSTEEITGHLKEYLGDGHVPLPPLAGTALRWLPNTGWLAGIAADLARLGATRMARRFIAASDLSGAIEAVRNLRAQHLAFTIDLLGEAVLSDAEAARYQRLYLRLIDGLAESAKLWERDDQIDCDHRGSIPPVNVSVKLSSLFSQFDPIDPRGTAEAVLKLLRPILRLARQRGVFVNIDMEQYAYKDVTLRIFKQVFAEPEFRDWTGVGIAIQAYLRDTGDDLHELAAWAEQRRTPVWVRLVKGAYWDFEKVIAAQNGWPVPVFTDKAATDANYEAQTTFLMQHTHLLRPAIASHNIRSISHAIAEAEAQRLPKRAYEFQMLYGMAEPIKTALVERGYRVRVYTPFGELLPGMAYLVRRLLENTSNESFLKAGFTDHVSQEKLLMNPAQMLNGRISSAPAPTKAFRNEPVTDFSAESARRKMLSALTYGRANLGKAVEPLVIGGKRIETGRWIESRNPANRDELVGKVASAAPEHAMAAIDAARAAFPAWRDTPTATRSGLLRRVAAVLRKRRFELAAVEVFETGKQWREADADIAEAIDFCVYYAGEMERLANPQHRDVPGEANRTFYEPRGVAVVIAPWNFPLAILCGMTSAAVVAGNTVVMKPAEQSPLIAAKLMEAYEEAGVPAGVLNYLPGVGEEIGPTLVQHKDVAMIAFTGSRAVGLQIEKQAADLAAGQDHIKRVIAELGGKNAVIIDADADLDEAVHGVVGSAFGYAGQKCSACSRVIVLDAVYRTFLDRLVEATRSLRVGPPEDPGCLVGPVIDDEAQRRIMVAIERGKREARLVYQADVADLPAKGSYVPPTIFADVSPASSLAQDEIFGPVLAVMRAATLDQAIEIANGTRYALTGGFFSRSPANIERVQREFRVGNLYINRKITGALVDRQPFGGFKLSGIGSKAGGPDYLLQFLLPRTITENTLRRGFAPEAEGE